MARGPSQSLSQGSTRMSVTHSKNWTTMARKNAMPNQGWMTLQTERPPKRYAIHPKIGVQMGIPVSRERTNVRATVQWTRREKSRCRTISDPTTTSSRCRATTIAESIGARGAAVLIGVLRSASGAGEVRVGVARAARLLGSVLRVVREGAGHGAEDRENAQRPEDPLPELHAPGHVRVRREPVPLGMIAVGEHGDDRRSVDAAGVVERGLREAVGLQLRPARLPEGDHVVLGPELQTAGRAGLDAGGLEADRDPVHAERALGHLPGGRMEPRHVERAAGLAVSAADALVRVDVDDAVGVLD